MRQARYSGQAATNSSEPAPNAIGKDFAGGLTFEVGPSVISMGYSFTVGQIEAQQLIDDSTLIEPPEAALISVNPTRTGLH